MPSARQEKSELRVLTLSDDTRNKHSRQFKAQPNILALPSMKRMSAISRSWWRRPNDMNLSELSPAPSYYGMWDAVARFAAEITEALQFLFNHAGDFGDDLRRNLIETGHAQGHVAADLFG